jgi:hypothetical protein
MTTRIGWFVSAPSTGKTLKQPFQVCADQVFASLEKGLNTMNHFDPEHGAREHGRACRRGI